MPHTLPLVIGYNSSRHHKLLLLLLLFSFIFRLRYTERKLLLCTVYTVHCSLIVLVRMLSICLLKREKRKNSSSEKKSNKISNDFFSNQQFSYLIVKMQPNQQIKLSIYNL